MAVREVNLASTFYFATILLAAILEFWQLKDISHFKSWQALESDVLGIRGSALSLVHHFRRLSLLFGCFPLRLPGP